MFWIDIIGSRVQCIMFRSIWWADPSVECYVIIILYTATGSVNKFDGWAGAKRAGDQQSKIGQKTKPATTSHDIFLILKAYPLWFSTHDKTCRLTRVTSVSPSHMHCLFESKSSCVALERSSDLSSRKSAKVEISLCLQKYNCDRSALERKKKASIVCNMASISNTWIDLLHL